jgi:glycosyltransferase involved in cell wall biosynthesis
MKVLHTVEYYWPSVGGMQEVVRQLSERLVKRGHDVTVASARLREREKHTRNGVKIVEFDVSGNSVRGLRGNISSYRDFLLTSHFDVITNFAAQQWATDVMLPILDRVKGKKVFVPTGFSALHDVAYGNYFEAMRTWMKQYDANVFLSNNYRDVDFARKYGARNVTVIPNGADENEFLPLTQTDIRPRHGVARDDFLILHVGSHTGLKGHAEAMSIFHRASIRNATLLIVGNSFGRGCTWTCRLREIVSKFDGSRADGKRIVLMSLSRDDTVAAYKTADLFLFPSNIECSPLVLFECMASKTPFLTTDVGNAAEIIEWSNGGQLLPTRKDDREYSHADIESSTRLLEALYQDSGRRTQMAESGFRAWQARFTWDKITQQYEELYKSLLY